MAEEKVRKCSNCQHYDKTAYECSNKQFKGAVALDSFCINNGYKYWVGKKTRKKRGA